MAATAAVKKSVPDAIKKTVYLRELLNDKNRSFAYGKQVQESYQKEFTAVNNDVRLMRFANDQLGAVSDCFILYAISMMGVTDVENIQLFLRVLSNKHKDLSISDMSNYDSVKKRVDALVRNGFLFKHRYEIRTEDATGKKIVKKINLYSIEKSGQYLVNQRLGTKVNINEWMDAKPLSELMGWAACGYVRGRVAASGKFIEHKQGIFRTKAIGTAMFPGEVKMQQTNGESVSVGFVQGFMRHNKAIQTVEQYEDHCYQTINLIKQYFYLKNLKHENACVVVVVEDNPDLMTVADFIHKTKALVDDYDRIFFTGEGVIRAAASVSEVKDGFLQLRAISDKDVDFIPCEPGFIA